MTRTIRQALHRLKTSEAGSISAEFVAVLIVVAALIAAVWASGIDSKVEDCATQAADNMFTDGATVECAGGGDDGGEEGGDQ